MGRRAADTPAMSQKQGKQSVTAPAGFSAAGGAFGIKPSGKADLAMIAADRPCPVAAVFTRSVLPSEAVQVARRHAASGRCRAIVVNAGVANASTGKRGLDDARAMCRAAAGHLGCKATEVIACSTGLIGEPLPMDRITHGIGELAGRLERCAEGDDAVAHAILTTDLVAKSAVRRIKLGGKTVTLGGIAKGSGMIAPNMGTMLAFVTTDAAVSLPRLRAALREAVEADASFNRISVDTDTSPSDTVAMMASGAAGNAPIRRADGDYRRFRDALVDLSRDLAYQVVADGEGATRVIRVTVEGARSHPEAVRVARAVVDSPLVKTAVHGGDPNWGRLAMAVGKSGATVRPGRLVLRIGGVEVYREGVPVAADPRKLERAMAEREVKLTVRLNIGAGRCEYLGCDLSREYITINADYHT